jgi:hypothetical protein
MTDDGCQVMAKAHLAKGKVSQKKSGKVENRNWPSLMVTDLVYEFQMIWLRETQITEWKRTDRRTRVKDNALVHSG